MRPTSVLVSLLALLTCAAAARAQTLAGSRTSLVTQNLGAAEEGFTYLRTSSEVDEFVQLGLLVRLSGNQDYELAAVSFPFARDEVKLFVERLASQYHNHCGERLVVTSLTRPITRQPRNASDLSVHPTGMAVDLRRSNRASCRYFLEETLLKLEGRGVVEATRERHPPHYHVSVFGTPYGRYLATRGVEDALEVTRLAKAGASQSSSTQVASAKTTKKSTATAKRYRVKGGDSLWEIARKHGTTVASIKRYNGIKSSRLRPGQVLSIPIRAK